MTTDLTVINDRPQFNARSTRPALKAVDARARFSVSLNGVKLLEPISRPTAMQVISPQRVSFAPQGGARVLIATRQGPPGPPGQMAAATLGVFECGEAITSSSLLHLSPIDGRLYLADGSELLPAHGFTIAGAAEGDEITVYRLGVLNGLGGLTAGLPRWLGTAGQTRATAPASGLIQSVGLAFATDQIFIELEEPEEVES